MLRFVAIRFHFHQKKIPSNSLTSFRDFVKFFRNRSSIEKSHVALTVTIWYHDIKL